MNANNGPLRFGIGGHVGSGKTALIARVCEAVRDRWSVAVINNDTYTREPAFAAWLRESTEPLDPEA